MGSTSVSLDELDQQASASANSVSLDELDAQSPAQPHDFTQEALSGKLAPAAGSPMKLPPEAPAPPVATPRGRGDVSHAAEGYFPPTDIPIQGVKDIHEGYQGFSGLPVPLTPVPAARGQMPRPAAPKPQVSPEQQAVLDQQANQRAKSAAKMIEGAGEVGTVALPGAIAAAPVATAVSIGAGTLASKGAGAAVHGKVSPEAEELTRQVAFFIPSVMGTVAGVKSAHVETPEGKFSGASAFGGKVRAGIARTPDVTSGRVKVGDTQFEVNIPRKPAPVPEPSEAAKALASFEQHTGNPDFQPAPPPPAPPGTNGPEHLTPDVVKGVSDAIMQADPAKRPGLMTEAHGNMVKWMVGRGTFVGPDSKIHTVDSEGQAKKLASKFINDEVDRRDAEQEANNKTPEAATRPTIATPEQPVARAATAAPIAGKPPAAGHMTTDTAAVKKVAAEANIHPEQQPAIAVKKEPPKETAALAQPPDPVKPEDVARIGKEDKESGRTILQPSDDVMQNERLAAHAAPELATKLSHIAASVEGATFDRLRPQKELERVDEKVDDAGKPPETVPDYLASQIAADSPQAKDQLVAAIKKNFNVIQVEDNFLEGKPELANYRSVNLQVQMGNGSTAEIQLVPREQQEIANESHVFYTAGREAGLRGDKAEQEKQYAKAAEMHDAAMEKFKQRNGIEKQKPSPEEYILAKIKEKDIPIYTAFTGEGLKHHLDLPPDISLRDMENYGVITRNNEGLWEFAPHITGQADRTVLPVGQQPHSVPLDELEGLQAPTPKPDQAMGNEAPVVPQESRTAERRTNTAERKRVEHLTPEERGHELLTSELTGLPNKRAFAEDAATMAETHPHVGYADIDDFKQFNSILGHEGVDEKVLPEIGEVFRRAIEKEPGGSVKVYHRSGDEFLFRSKDEAAISRVVDRVNKELETAIFTAESPDGKIHTKQGAGLKNGTGRNAKEAEHNAEFGDHPGSKKSRTAAGLRSGARDIPERVGEKPAEGEQTGGREGSQSVPLEELERVSPKTNKPDIAAEKARIYDQIQALNKERNSIGFKIDADRFNPSAGTKALVERHTELGRNIRALDDEVAKLDGQPTSSEKRDIAKNEAEKKFAERPTGAMKYGDAAQSQPWQVSEKDFIARRFESEAKRYEKAVAEQEKKVADLKPGSTKRISEESSLHFWKERLAKLKAGDDPRITQEFRNAYIKHVKEAISHGRPVPQEVIDQHPEFVKAQDARERYEKGKHTSFSNRSVAINDTMQKELGFKVKRQDGKPITDEQIKEIHQSVKDVESVIGPMADIMRGVDLTVVHTNGKFPFLMNDAAGLFSETDRRITVGLQSMFSPRSIPVFAHEIGHMIDIKGGNLLGESARLYTKGGKGYTTTALSEADAKKFKGDLISQATEAINNVRKVRELLRAKKTEDLTPEEKQEIEGAKVKLGPYWREPREVFARLFEQYIANKLGKRSEAAQSPESYAEQPGYWTQQQFEKFIPKIESEINRRLEALHDKYGAPGSEAPKAGAGDVLPEKPSTTEAEVDAMVAKDYAETNDPAKAQSRIYSTVLASAENKFAKGEITQKQLDNIKAKYGPAPAIAQFDEAVKHTGAEVKEGKPSAAFAEKIKDATHLEPVNDAELKEKFTGAAYQREYFKAALGEAKAAWAATMNGKGDGVEMFEFIANKGLTSYDEKQAPEGFKTPQLYIKVPGDGHFLVNNTPFAIEKALKGATRGFAASRASLSPEAKIKKFSAPKATPEAVEKYRKELAEELRSAEGDKSYAESRLRDDKESRAKSRELTDEFNQDLKKLRASEDPKKGDKERELRDAYNRSMQRLPRQMGDDEIEAAHDTIAQREADIPVLRQNVADFEQQFPAKAAATKPTTGLEPGSMRASAFGLDILAKQTGTFFQEDVAPTLKGVAGGLKDVTQRGLRVIAPRVGVPSHLLDTIMKMKGQREEEMYRFQRTTEGMKKMFDKLPEEARLSFIDRMMHGQRQPSTELEDVADSIRAIQDRFRDQEKVFKPDLTDKENYFHLKWTKLPQGVDEDGNLIEGTGGERPNTGQGNRPLQGGRSFMKRKTLPDASSGIKRGGELLTTNPIGLLEHRVQESLKFTTARKMWEELKDTPYTVSDRGRPMHMVQFFREGQGQQARALGYEQLNDRIAKVLFPAGSGEGMVHPGEYWVEQNAARLLNNFLSRDLIRESSFGRGVVGLKNATTAWRLAFSPFHALVESIITTGSEVGRGIEHSFNQGVRQGSPAETAKGIGIAAKAPVAPFTAAREGGGAIRYVTSPQEFLATTRGQNFISRYPEAAELVSDLFTGGAKLAMHEDFRMKMVESMRQAMADNNYIGAALRTPGALSQAIQYPLFEVYIPRLKLGMFLREYSEALADREPEIEAGKLTRAKLARETWDNIDYRFGEVNWDNFFFNRTFKTSLQLAFRAFAWRFGNFAFTGSGVTGQARQVAESLKFLKDSATGGESARPGTNAIPKIDPRMAKLLGLAIFGLIAHGMLQWALTREKPKDAKDLIAPRDGTLDSHGHPNRWTLPIVPYRDLESAKSNPMGYLRGGTADIWTAIPEAINNRDFRNHLISHPSDPYWEQMFDKAAHVVGVPIGVDRYRQEKKRGEGTGNALLGEAGLSRATNYELTPAEKKMREIQIAHYGPETDEDLEAREKKDERIAAGRLTPKEMQDKVRSSMKNNFERGMKSFTYEQARQVYDVASPEEKALMGMMLLRKRFNSRRTAAGGE